MKRKQAYLVAGGIVLLAIGYFIGRASVVEKVTVEYVQLPPVDIDPPAVPDPIEVVPKNPILPPKVTKPSKVYVDRYIDSGYQEKYNDLLLSYHTLGSAHKVAVDSLAVYKDYITLRKYTDWELYSADTLGRFIASFDVQFNRIQNAYNMRLYPVQKTVMKIKKPTFSFFALAGADTKLESFDITGGVIIKRCMLGAGIDYSSQTKERTFKVKAGVTF